MRQVLHVNEPGLGRDDGSCVMMYHKFQPQHRAYKVLCPPPLIKRRLRREAQAQAPSEIRRGGKMRLEWFPRSEGGIKRDEHNILN